MKNVNWLAMAAGLAIGGVAFGQEAKEAEAGNAAGDATKTAGGSATPRVEEAAESESAFGVSLTLDYTTGYYFRGFLQEDSGLILQPGLTLSYTIHETDDWSLGAFAGVWNSFHGQETGEDTESAWKEPWYEIDYYGGLTLAAGRWEFGASYIFYTSPSDAWQSVQEIMLTAAFDDSEYLGAWTMRPRTLLAFETGSNFTDGADARRGTYLELGIAPGPDAKFGETTVEIRFPVTVGFSLHEYYEDSDGNDDTFGYAQFGAKAGIPLDMPDGMGDWTLNAGVSLLVLGQNMRDYNEGDGHEMIATIGVAVEF
ncbi:MAG: hypothetical protein JNL50_02225 [Phycisphaerae bacterium]|nr:hypothetical protein [Phycisphaerae bacterium]